MSLFILESLEKKISVIKESQTGDILWNTPFRFTSAYPSFSNLERRSGNFFSSSVSFNMIYKTSLERQYGHVPSADTGNSSVAA